MRLRTFSLAVLCCLVAVVASFPSPASAKVTVGISENNVALFGDPLFQSLGSKRVRVVASWDSVKKFNDGTDTNEVTDRLDPYTAAAAGRGIEVMVAIEHGRGAPINCGASSSRGTPQCRLPSVKAYKSALTEFVKRYPTVKYITAWNEANHNTQPTFRNAKRAGQFAKAADQVCRKQKTCKVIAMDILDSANNPSLPTRRLNYSKTKRYVKQLRKAYGKTPAICGIHNYADVNRFRTKGTKAIIKAGKCKQYWLTETGGIYKFGSFWKSSTRRQYKCKSATKCQTKATNYLFKKTIRASKRIKRVYVFNFFRGTDGEHDYGLTTGTGVVGAADAFGRRRPAYNIVKKRV